MNIRIHQPSCYLFHKPCQMHASILLFFGEGVSEDWYLWFISKTKISLRLELKSNWMDKNIPFRHCRSFIFLFRPTEVGQLGYGGYTEYWYWTTVSVRLKHLYIIPGWPGFQILIKSPSFVPLYCRDHCGIFVGVRSSFGVYNHPWQKSYILGRINNLTIVMFITLIICRSKVAEPILW